MEITCRSKYCLEDTEGEGYTWNYKGNHPFYASCPRCHYKVKIPIKEK